MKTITILLIGLLILTCFTIGYYSILDKTNYGVPTYDEYRNNPECEFKQLGDGYIQLTNCVKYKFVGRER